MKSGSTIELTRAWWKKEAPDGLKKSAPAFEKAIEDLAKARAALEGGGDAAARALEKAALALEKAAKDVAAEAKELEKKEKDKARRKDLQNTAEVMGKPLEKALGELGAEIDAERGGGEDDDAGDDVLSDPALHAAWVKKVAAKLKRGTWNFALGLPSTDPAEMRFNFHRKKGGRVLGAQLKKAIGAKKFTFGKAGTQELAEDVSGEDVSGRTLVLYLEGRNIPGLAKRVKLMLRLLGVSSFGKVKVVHDGQELDSADDDADDAPLEAVDLDTPEEGEGEEAPEAPPEPPAPDDRAALLARRLAAAGEALKAMPDGPAAAKLREAAKGAGARIRSGDLDGAEKLIAALEGRLGAQEGSGEGAAEAPPPPPPPPESGGPERGEALRRALGTLVRRIRALDDAAAAEALEGRAGAVLGLLREGQIRDAEAEIAAIREALEAAAGGPGETRGGDPLAIWIAAKETADEGISELQAALRGFGHPDLDRIVEHGLYGATEGNQVALNRVLREYNAAPGPETAERLKAQVAEFRSFLASSTLIKLCEKNPFGVKVEIARPLGEALDRIEETVGG